MSKALKLQIAAATVALLLIALWMSLDHLRSVNGQTYAQWHSQRESAFKELRRELRPIVDIFKGNTYFSGEVIERQALKVNEVAQRLPALFEAEAPSGAAKAEIWQAKPEFDALMTEFLNKTANLASNPPQNLEALSPLVDALQLDCAGCHRKFRD